MNTELHETAGRHDAEIEKLQNQMDQVLAELKEILSTLDEARGGWRTMMWLGGAIAAVIGILATSKGMFNS